ncbi:hypothetical protein LTR53_005742 [Teratosphaeriaceae sp. CCFEE 6253]|nr:hypothetical protein LTR53_005742 [Teratosphaeriaceae sp. CCFEE 6253]
MLSRPATKISLTADDIIAYEHRKEMRDSMRADEMDSSRDSSNSTVDDATEEQDSNMAQQARAAKLKAAREQRMGLGGPSRG